MRIAVAQTRPVKGDVPQNIDAHIRFIELAGAAGAAMIVFPELSITGYEPGLASRLATTVDDVRLDVFETLSEQYSMTVCIGIPSLETAGVRITELIFEPGEPRKAYSKRWLHADEEPFFIRGDEAVFLAGKRIALAICYELSVPAHPEEAWRHGAQIYLVSAAKTKSGMERASATLAEIARRFSMTVFVSNCIGPCDDFKCGGGSAVWNNSGALVAQLAEAEEGILVFDTETGEIIKKELPAQLYES